MSCFPPTVCSQFRPTSQRINCKGMKADSPSSCFGHVRCDLTRGDMKKGSPSSFVSLDTHTKKVIYASQAPPFLALFCPQWAVIGRRREQIPLSKYYHGPTLPDRSDSAATPVSQQAAGKLSLAKAGKFPGMYISGILLLICHWSHPYLAPQWDSDGDPFPHLQK